VKISSDKNFLRISAISLGILWLFWLPVEDSSLFTVYLFALGISLLIAIWLQRSRLWGSWKPTWRMVSLGSLAGLLVTPLALILMVFKSGLHGHLTPDYTSDQILTVLKNSSIWLIGGGMVGLGLQLWISSASSP